MKQILTKQNTGFTQIKNDVIKDLPYHLIGLYVHIYSKPDDWDFSSYRIADEIKLSERTVKDYLKELEEIGYLERQRLSSGKVKYYINYDKKPECNIFTMAMDEPECKKAPVQKSPRAKFAPISNKESKIIKKETNTSFEGKPSTAKPKFDLKSSSLEISEVIKEMIKLDPKNKLSYGNPFQRKSADFLIQEYGFEEVKKMIDLILVARVKVPYLPSVTSCSELKDKWQKIINMADSEKMKGELTKTKSRALW